MSEPESESAETRPESGQAESFTREAQQQRVGFFGEFWAFLKDNKKWWLLPLVLVLLLLGLLAFFTSTGVAPFIYTIF